MELVHWEMSLYSFHGQMDSRTFVDLADGLRKTATMDRITKFLLPLVCLLLPGCQTLPMPQNTAAGYQTARFVQKRPQNFPSYSREALDSPEFSRNVHQAIASTFQANGIPIVEGEADLLIAYLLFRQGNTTTTMNQDYFGYGRDALAIMEEAHTRGVISRKRADVVDDAGIVIDVLDTKTDRLVFRGFAKRPVMTGIPAAARQERLNQAVADALAPFFR
jgi:hypothetical protein